MPNWVYNVINADEDVLEDIKKRFIDDNGNFDFNRLIPMPVSLDVTSGSTNYYDIYYYLSKRNTLPFEEVVDKLPEFIPEYFLASMTDRFREMEKQIANGAVTPDYNMGRQLVTNVKLYGSPDWYDWHIKHWGTKWNACNTSTDDSAIRFETAWNVPKPIFEVLCQMYPDAELGIYCEEETGWSVEFSGEDGVLYEVVSTEAN